MLNKKWLKSKTVWANVVFIIAFVLTAKYGIEIDAETQAILSSGILAVINIILRLKTNQGLIK